MLDRAIALLIIAAIAIVLTLVIINANTVNRVRRPLPKEEQADLAEPLPAETRRTRVVRTVRRGVRRPRRAASRSVVQSSTEDYYAQPDPRYTGPPPVVPWYARGWRGRMRRRASVPVDEVVEEAPVDADDGTGTETPTATEPLPEPHPEIAEEHDRLI